MDLTGAIDLHVHSAPDVYPRLLDDIDLARQYEAAGARAILLKSHHTLTADRAFLVNKLVDLEVFGGLALNHSVGGLNPIAVETALAFGAREIWLPTLHAQHCLEVAEQEMFRAEVRKGRRGIRPLGADGRPDPNLMAILEMIRDADIALGTGHISPGESLEVLRYARDLGIRRLVVTHPLMSFTRFTREQMQEAAALGAVLEFDRLSCMPNWHASVPVAESAQAIRAVGPQHCVLGTDGGQAHNPSPPEMLRSFAEELHAHGIRHEDLRLMMCENPARILGL